MLRKKSLAKSQLAACVKNIQKISSLHSFFPKNQKIGPFQVFNDTVMIYNTRNWSNDTTESQKKRPNLMLIFSTVSQESRD